MSSLDTKTAVGEFNYTGKINKSFHNNNTPRHAFKSKENIYKHKCNRVLKKKLKKYKLRKDGQEDQDVIDVSENLHTKLKIKCLYTTENNHFEIDDFRPLNYLTTMVRRKQTTLKDSKITYNSNIISINPKTCQISEVILVDKKKTTNAFQVMMDSRNKSIGGNSPGKDVVVDEAELIDIRENNEIKAKRKLTLQKMAEAKGALKNQEKEEFQENYIKRKLEKRAERLKKMVLKNTKSPKKIKEPCTSKKNQAVPNASKKKTENSAKSITQLVNIFSETETIINETKTAKKQVSKEDEDFLSKLSPSIKKKENMLCYFKKVDKEPDSAEDKSDNNVIKVKISSKKFIKKKKLSLKTCDKEHELDQNVTSEINSKTDMQSKTKRKEEKKMKDVAKYTYSVKECNIKAFDNVIDDNRPRRSVKRPIKYIDEVTLTSSDDELHIYTPKKKKKQVNAKINDSERSTPIKTELINSDTKRHMTNNNPNKKGSKCGLKKEKNVIQVEPVKLAPIFAVKPQLDSAQIEAKQKFLQSGIPEKLRKVISSQKTINQNLASFPEVSHVLQQSETAVKNLTNSFYSLFNSSNSEESDDETTYVSKNSMRDILILPSKVSDIAFSLTKVDIKSTLDSIKSNYPKFPVYRTYRLLKSKKNGEYKELSFAFLDNSVEVINGLYTDMTSENPDKLNWTEKYKAISSNQIIGNFESVKEIKRWLVNWTENDLKSKKNTVAGSDSSDFYDSDPDSKDSMKSTNNLLILNGPSGCGKTSNVYAIAAELSIKVIEVNASSKRTGKIMLQDLQEATQSHKVNRGKGSSTENSQKSQEIIEVDIPKIKKRGRPKKMVTGPTKKPVLKNEDSEPSSQDPERTVMSLILVDDADVIFDQDDGFCAAVAQLVQFSKRPVILVTSSLSCAHLQRFINCGKIVTLQPLMPRMLGTWLDVMCLADSGVCWPGSGCKLLDFFKGDIRKTINHLQFLMSGQIISKEEDSDSQGYRPNIDDENSSISWAEHDPEERNVSSNGESLCVWKHLMKNHSQLIHPSYPLDIFNVWWSFPTLLDLTNLNSKIDRIRAKNTQLEIQELNAISNALDAFSTVDYNHQIKPDTRSNVASDPWYSFESDSMSEKNNMDSYNKCYELIDDISSCLLTKSIIEAQNVLGCENKTDVDFPGMTTQRKRDRTIARHTKLTDYLNPAAVFDRKALALDYWPACRTICRIENEKTDCNLKRNNRFCHYLKSLNIQCKNEYFDQISKSLCPNDNDEL